MVIELNWSKAKSILIIAFILTNVFLAANLLSEENKELSTVKDSFVEDVLEILGRKNISVDAEIPDELPSLNMLNVKYEITDYYNINNKYFGGRGSIEEIDEDKVIISWDQETVSIENAKKIKYKNNRESTGYNELDPNKAEEMVERFLRDRGHETLGMDLWSLEEDKLKNQYELKYSMVYEERYLELAYTNVLLDNDGVLELERLWLIPLEEGEIPIYINTAPKALLDLIDKEKFYGKTIADISLCYYFNPEEDDYVEEPEEAKEGRAIPAWRIIFKDGTKTIIDNY